MKKNLSQIAQESERVEEVRIQTQRTEELRRDELAEPVTNEPELASMGEEIAENDREFDEDQSEAVAMEALQLWRNELERQIKSKTVSLESIQLIQMGVQQIYASQGVRIRTVAQESNLSAEAYGQIVLESVFGAIGNNFVLPIKRWKDRFTDLFRSAEGNASKYREKLTTARTELHRKQGEFKGRAEVNMHELWAFFSTDGGQAPNIVPALQKDLAMSKYVLVEYPTQILKLLGQLTAACRQGDVSSPEAAKRFFLEIEKLPHPADMFNHQFVTGDKKPFLGVTGIQVKEGSKRKVLSMDGQAFQKLAEMASAKKIVEGGSLGHNVANIAGKVPGYIGMAVQAASIVGSKNAFMSFQDVDKAITFGEEYVNNVEAYKKLEPQLISALEAMDEAFDPLMRGDGQAGKEAKMLFNQVWWYAINICEAAFSPAATEVQRSLRGARYTAYLARRAIFHRTDKEKGGTSGSMQQKLEEPENEAANSGDNAAE